MSVFSMVANRMQAVVWLGWSARGESTARMVQVSKFVYMAQIYGLHYVRRQLAASAGEVNDPQTKDLDDGVRMYSLYHLRCYH